MTTISINKDCIKMRGHAGYAPSGQMFLTELAKNGIICEIDFIKGRRNMNISEFAEYAGVSKSAVSRYFNKGYLSDDKREMIEKAIAETGYSPSLSARAIKTRVTKLV